MSGSLLRLQLIQPRSDNQRVLPPVSESLRFKNNLGLLVLFLCLPLCAKSCNSSKTRQLTYDSQEGFFGCRLEDRDRRQYNVMKLLTLKRDVISQMNAQYFLNGPQNTGARMPGSREPEGRPPRRTLSSPSRPACRKARESACVTASSGSRRKFFKLRKSLLASP